MIRTVLMIILIAGVILTLLLEIPGLYSGIATLIDDVFDTSLATLIENIWDTVPQELIDLFVVGFSTLAICILISLLSGGKK